METLQIDKSNALKAYNDADKSGKALLSNLFGEKVFKSKITDRVKSFEDACRELGKNPEDLKYFGRDDILAYDHLCTIAEALNEGWKPDWENENEYKWYPWWVMKGGFRLDDVYGCYARTGVGSRLCFKNEELAKYAAIQFQSLYKDYLTI